MASRKEEKERRRQERLAAEAAAAKGDGRRLYGIIAGAVLVIGVVVVIVLIASSGGGSESTSNTPSGGPEIEFAGAVDPPAIQESDLFKAAKTGKCELISPPIEGQQHVDTSVDVNYKTSPPSSGNHNVQSQPDGVYSGTPYPRHWVHALEGGRVMILYKPRIDQQRIKQLGGLYNNNQPFLTMFPYRDMPYDVAFVSWGQIAGCKKVSDATYDVGKDFIERYRDTAPEAASTHQLTVDASDWPGPVPKLESEAQAEKDQNKQKSQN